MPLCLMGMLLAYCDGLHRSRMLFYKPGQGSGVLLDGRFALLNHMALAQWL